MENARVWGGGGVTYHFHFGSSILAIPLTIEQCNIIAANPAARAHDNELPLCLRLETE